MKPYYHDEASGITIYCGDCREVLPTLCRGKIEALVTDPPYGIFACGGKWGRKEELQWDKSPATGISDMASMAEFAIIWGGNYFSLPPSRGWLVWYKRDSVPSAADVELAWTNIDMNSRLIDQTIAATNKERCGHPAQKPLLVMLWTLSFIPEGNAIIDPFMGSGTTLVAAKQFGLACTGIEVSERYCEIAANRLAQGTLFAPEPPPAIEQEPALFLGET